MNIENLLWTALLLAGAATIWVAGLQLVRFLEAVP
jgi:hypothetical protein